jgi:hypothetical protein
MGCKSAKFELSSLTITPSTVATGDTATISVDLENVGSAEGTYTLTFSLDAVVIDTMDVTIPAETTRKVTCTVVKEAIGEYTAEVGELSGTLYVVKPAEFQLSSLVVTPQEVLPDGEVTVTVDVANIGGLEGDYVCTLVVNDSERETQELTVDGGVTETVTFSFTPSYAGGRCDIEIGDLFAEIRTLRPADIKVTSVSVSPYQVEVGSSVTITVELRNSGDVEGSETVTLEVDGEPVGTRSVTVDGTDTATIDFNVTENTIGRHYASVDGKGTSFTVLPVVPPGYIGFTSGWSFLDERFFIIYPEGWEEQLSEDFILLVHGPMQANGSYPALNIVSESLPQEMTAWQYFEAASSWVYSSLLNYQVVSTEEIVVDGIPAVKHTFTLTVQGINMTMIQVMLVIEEVAYIGTFVVSTIYYNNFAETINTIINSFQFIP